MMETGAWHHSRTNETGQTEPLYHETHSTVGSQKDSATHWLEVLLHTSLKMYPQPGGKTCGSDSGQLWSDMFVMAASQMGGWIYSKAKWCKKKEEIDQYSPKKQITTRHPFLQKKKKLTVWEMNNLFTLITNVLTKHVSQSDKYLIHKYGTVQKPTYLIKKSETDQTQIFLAITFPNSS